MSMQESRRIPLMGFWPNTPPNRLQSLCIKAFRRGGCLTNTTPNTPPNTPPKGHQPQDEINLSFLSLSHDEETVTHTKKRNSLIWSRNTVYPARFIPSPGNFYALPSAQFLLSIVAKKCPCRVDRTNKKYLYACHTVPYHHCHAVTMVSALWLKELLEASLV